MVCNSSATAISTEKYLSSLSPCTLECCRQQLYIYPVPVCQQLVDRACQVKVPEKVVLLEDFALALDDNSGQPVDRLRQHLPVSGLLALYVGNLEPYQGLDLLLAGFAQADPQCDLSLVLIGGSPADVADYQAKASSLGISQRVYFLGPRPVSQLNDYLSQADILVSPRLKGVNTPMKIFSYLDSGRPIIATDISSHTQVLDSGCALLVAVTGAAHQEYNTLGHYNKEVYEASQPAS